MDPQPMATPVSDILRWADSHLPDDYLDLLQKHEGEFCNDTIRLYCAAELIERNESYQTKIYCPGFITIGDDSGGHAVVIALGKLPGPVYLVDHGSMSPDDFRVIAPDIRTWVAGGCAIEEPREEHFNYRVSVRWEGKLATHALKVLREHSPLAKDMSLLDLSSALSGNQLFDLGILAGERRAEILRQLLDAGFVIAPT